MSDDWVQTDRLARPGLEGLLERWAGMVLAVYWPVLAIATHWPRLNVPNPTVGVVGLDKLLHVASFGLLALLLIYALIAWRPARCASSVWVGMVVAGLYAVVDELTQHFFQRAVSLKDLCADLVGVVVVGLVVWRHVSPAHLAPALTSGPSRTAGEAGDRTAGGPVGFMGHALLVGALTFVSRLLGLARDSVLAACFGMTAITDAFWIGFVVPNLFRRLFGEGALTAAFVPVYTDLLDQDRAAARRLASLCVAILLMALGALTLLGELSLAWLGTRQWSGDTQLAIRLTMIMLPYMPLVCMAALLGGVLQVHRRFGPPAAAPILLNVVMIAVTLVATLGAREPSDLRRAIAMVAISVVVAGLLQLAWQVWVAARCGVLALEVAGVTAPLRSVGTLMLPMVFGLAVFQVNALFDSLIAWGLSPKGGGQATFEWFGWQVDYPVRAGAVTGLQYAQRLYQFPLGVFGVALATAIFPALARSATTAHRAADFPAAGRDAAGVIDVDQRPFGQFRMTVQHGLRLTMFVGLPASIGLILVRVPLTRVIFERQQFTVDDSIRVATILAGYASAVWAYAMTHVLTRAFYALKDARTPLRTSAAMVSVNVVLNLLLVWRLGAVALAWSTAVCAIGQVILLLWSIQRRVDRVIDGQVWRGWARSALLTVVMAAVLAPITLFYNPAMLSTTTAGVELLVLVSSGVAIVLVGAKLLGADELSWLLQSKKVA